MSCDFLVSAHAPAHVIHACVSTSSACLMMTEEPKRACQKNTEKRTQLFSTLVV